MSFCRRVRLVVIAAVSLSLAWPAAAQTPARVLPERKPPVPGAARSGGPILPERKPAPPGRTQTRAAETPVPAAAAARIAPRAEPAHLSARDRQLFAEALKSAAAGRWPAARDAVRRTGNALLFDIVEWLALRTPGAKLDFAERTAFIAARSHWPNIAEIRRITEDVADKSGPDERLRWFAQHPPVTTAGKVAYADAALSAGDLPLAEKLAREAWIGGRFDADDEREFLDRFGRFIGPEQHRARLEELLYAEQATAAQRMIRRVPTPLAAAATVRLALFGDAGNADRLLQMLPPDLAADPGVVYDRIKWRRSRDRLDDARALLPDAPDTAPRPDLWWRERQILARDSLLQGRAAEAYRIVQNHGALDAVSVSEAEWLAGWIALRFLDDGEKALQHFQKVYDTVQLAANLSRGAYWTGRAAERLGRADIAADWYRKAAVHITTFYGQLALSRLTDPTLPQLPLDPTPTPAEREAFEAKDLTRAARALADVPGMPHLRNFLLALADSSDFAAERHMAAELAGRLGRADLGVWIARQAGRDRIIIMTHGYPLPSFPLAAAPEKALALAIIRQESNFDPVAESPAGALGLMQLMPATARATAKALKLGYDKRRLTRDPLYNVRLGSAYLNGLVEDFNGSYIMAAAAYNAGPSRARQWARTYGDPRAAGVDAIDWIESIPFSETRNYVQRVMENLMVYRAVLAGSLQVPQTLEKELKGRPTG